MSGMIVALFVKLDQKRFIAYLTDVLFLISFGNIWRVSEFTLSGQHEDFTFKDVFVGRLAEDYDLLNYFSILAKLIPNIETLIGMADF